MAISDLGEDSRDFGVGDMAQEAARAALRSLGEPYAIESVRISDVNGDPQQMRVQRSPTISRLVGPHTL
jgi:hypothetical protein